MSLQNKAVILGTAFLCLICLWGAGAQVVKGATWGGSGKGRVYRDQEPIYFWFLFVARVFLGIFGLAILAFIRNR